MQESNPNARTLSGKNTKAKHAFFVINNYTEESYAKITAYFEKGDANYILAGEEIAPSTGTPHIQGYIQWKKQTGYARLAKDWKAAFGNCHGSSQENYDYCTATGKHCLKNPDGQPNKFLEWGEFRDSEAGRAEGAKKGGEATIELWNEVRKAAEEGRMQDIPSDMYIKYYGAINKIRLDHMPRPKDNDGDLKNLWIFGVPGTGKSVLARKIPTSDYYMKNRNKWWDNFQGEKYVILEEVSKKDGEWLGDFLKIWADRYAFMGETKGSSKYIRPEHLIVTSNYSIDTVFPKDGDKGDEDLNAAIKRRFDSLEMLPNWEHPTGRWNEEQLAKECDKWRTKYQINNS